MKDPVDVRSLEMEKTDAGSPVRSHLFSIGFSVRLAAVGDLRTDDRTLEMPVCGERKMSP